MRFLRTISLLRLKLLTLLTKPQLYQLHGQMQDFSLIDSYSFEICVQGPSGCVLDDGQPPVPEGHEIIDCYLDNMCVHCNGCVCRDGEVVPVMYENCTRNESCVPQGQMMAVFYNLFIIYDVTLYQVVLILHVAWGSALRQQCFCGDYCCTATAAAIPENAELLLLLLYCS